MYLPPYSNTGVENTNTGLKALIDWFQFTVLTNHIDSIFGLLGIKSSEFVIMKKGLNGYLEQRRCGNIVVLSKGSPGMGINVMMPGQGCREYENRFGDNWKELIRGVFRAGGHFTRLDVAVDDRQGYFTLDMVRQKVVMGDVRTVFKGVDERKKYHLGDSVSKVTGETLYFGSKESSLRVRMYDKAKERGQECFWNRCEVESRDDRSDVLASEIIGGRGLGVIILSVLKRCLNFVERSADSNKARWAVSDWWSCFLGAVGKIRLAVMQVKKTITQIAGWIERQVAPSLALVEKSLGDGFDSYLKSVIYSGQERWKDKHRVILEGGQNG
jgi:phage replication initiation protein